MAELRSFPQLFATFVVTLVFSLMALVGFIVEIVRKGPRRMLCARSRNVRPEILVKSKHGTHEFVRLRSKRLKLHCVVNGPVDKPLMVFIHGLPEFWYSWRHQLTEFSKDYRTVAYDMRGYGESDKPSGISQYTVDELTEDLEELLTELGRDKCTLVGHDWGGMVAWSFAALHPEQVERLIICNCPHPRAFPQHLKSSLSQLRKSWYMFFFQVPVLPELFMLADDLRNLGATFCGRRMGAKRGTFTAEDLEAYKYTFADYGDWTGPINYLRAGFRYASPRVYSAFKRGKIVPPTLLIWGTKDGALEKKMAELSAGYVEEFNVEYIEGASHWVQQEEPEQVNRLIRQALTGTTSEDRYRQFFVEADGDGSGHLTLEKLRATLRQKGYADSDTKIKAMLHSVDSSGDSKISYEEYMTAMRQTSPQEHKAARMRACFRSFDTNDDGHIDRSELEAVFRELGRYMSPSELDRIIKMADKDASGTLDYDEFVEQVFHVRG